MTHSYIELYLCLLPGILAYNEYGSWFTTKVIAWVGGMLLLPNIPGACF